MKKLIVSICALLLIGGAINAQAQTKTPEDRAKSQADKIKSVLVLNEEQSAKVYDILLASAVQKDSVIAKNPGSDASTLMELLKPINEARDTKIKAVLTTEQAVLFDAKKAELLDFESATP
jgi:hypothetical protein